MAHRYAIGFLVAALLVCPVFRVGAQGEATDLYKRGLRAYRAGKTDQAIELFRQTEDLDPVYPYPVFALARLYQQFFEQEMSHYRDAAEEYERLTLLLRINPPGNREKALYQAFYFEGLLYLKGGDHGKAVRALETFLELVPDFYATEQVHNAIGIAYYHRDEYEMAVRSFRAALELKPDYPEARFNLRSVYTRLATYNEAIAAMRAGDRENALRKIQRLKEFAPRYLRGRRLEGDLLRDLNRPAEAVTVYREILALNPGAPVTFGTRIELAKLFLARGERARARQMVRDNRTRFAWLCNERAEKEMKVLEARLGAVP